MNNDLISREALKKSMRKSINERYISWTKTITVADIATLIFDEIEYAPTIKPTITCKECDGYEAGYSAGQHDARPQGEWIDTGRMEEYWEEEYQCSICGAKDHWHNFCPHCGADMRKEEEHD